MALLVTPTQDAIELALWNFLVSIMPAGLEVIMMQQNRVGEPMPDNFVAMNPISRPRLATNIQNFFDVSLTGSISGVTLTATAVTGMLVAGLPILGTAVAAGTTLGVQKTGTPGGIGTYGVTPAQSITSRLLSAGSRQATQKNEVVMQVDVHGDDSSDNVEVISTMFRDPYAAEFFAASGVDMSALYADDPRQLPFINAEQQYETRWSVDLHLEANQTVLNVPQQFAAALALDLISVDAAYPE